MAKKTTPPEKPVKPAAQKPTANGRKTLIFLNTEDFGTLLGFVMTAKEKM